MGAFNETSFSSTAFDPNAFDLAAIIAIPATPDYFFTADKQIAFTSNINSLVLTADKKVSYTSDLGS